jgi:hypothetical protein
MIALGCLMTAVMFLGLFGIAALLTSTLVGHICNGWLVRFLLKYFFINSMNCRMVARSLGSDVLD